VVPAHASAELNFRYAPGRSRDEAEARLRELVPAGELHVLHSSPSAPPALANPLVERLRALVPDVAPKQAWTPVAQFAEQRIDAIDRGEVRVAEKVDGEWRVNEEAKKAILEYFRLRKVEPIEVGPFEYLDKIPLKHDYAERGVRVVPPATARYGSFLSPGVILMPSYVNIGAWVGPNTMVDTWATVGS